MGRGQWQTEATSEEGIERHQMMVYSVALFSFALALTFGVVVYVRNARDTGGSGHRDSSVGSTLALGDASIFRTAAAGDSGCVPEIARADEDRLLDAYTSNMQWGKIFVSIASYRDDECKDTVYEMFERARYPDNVAVGVVQQNKSKRDGGVKEDCFESCAKCKARKDRGQIRVLSYDFREARGPCFARYKASTLWRGEEWYLQIDSHMKFEDGWDVTMLNELARTNDPMAVLGGYPPTEAQMDAIKDKNYTETPVMCSGSFNKDGIPEMKASIVPVPPDKMPLPIPFVGAGMMCFPGRALFEVPFDPYLAFLFFGEEITFSARLWTHGYNFYAPARPFCSHHYERGGKPKFWDDLKDFERCRGLAVKRIKYILGLPSRGSVKLEDVPADYRVGISSRPGAKGISSTYGLGRARSIEEYWKYAGIDLEAKTVASRCKEGYARLGA